MEQLQVTGANLGAQLVLIRESLEAVRIAKLGSKQPQQWVVPLSASKLTVNTAKLASLNAKRRVGDRIDTLLLELVRLQEAARAAQELSYKHCTLKLLQANATEDARVDTEERQTRQDARVEEAAKRSETTAAPDLSSKQCPCFLFVLSYLYFVVLSSPGCPHGRVFHAVSRAMFPLWACAW